MGSKRSEQAPPRRSQKMQRLDNVPSHIFTPRTYQVELLDKALHRNTIVCLNTSVGKTFIMVQLIKELSFQLRMSLEKATVLLVDSADCVDNYAELLQLHTDLFVSAHTQYCDKWNSNRWHQLFKSTQVFVMPGQVFLTVLQNEHISLSQFNLLVFDECHNAVADHPYVQIMQYFNKLPTEVSHPRVLGLTASVLNNGCATPGELENSLSNLEETLHSTAETSTDNLVADVYSAKPTEIVLDCEHYEDDTGLLEEFDSILKSSLSFLDDMNPPIDEDSTESSPVTIPRTAFNECHVVLHSLGPWCCGKVAGALAKQVVKVSEHETGEWGRRLLQFALTQLSMIDHIMSEVFDKEVLCIEDFHRYMSPRVRKLIEVLHSYRPDDNFMIIGSDAFDISAVQMDGEGDEVNSDIDNDSFKFSDDEEFAEEEEESAMDTEGSGDSNSADKNEPKIKELDQEDKNDDEKAPVHYVAMRKHSETGSDSPKDTSLCGIVFVERRHVAFILNKLIVELCNWDPDLFFVKSHTITDKPGSKRGKKGDVQFKKQEEILRKFRQKEYNLLISTGVLEEGVDLPRCNVIVRFDLPQDYRSYVQSKGRCRAQESKYYMLVQDEEKKTFHTNLETFRGFEKILLSKFQDSDNEGMAGLDKFTIDSFMPPYQPCPDEGAPKITLSSAIMLVNRYCAKLPSDAFTHLTAQCSMEHESCDEGRRRYRATLQLPINSPIKQPITGEWMEKKKLAMMAVALKTCIILHKEGELDDNFQPVGKEMIRYEDDENEWEETDGQARPGTTKRKQYYLKKIAAPLLGQPVCDTSCYLYKLGLRLRCPITEEQNTRGRKIHAPEDATREFGIISEHWMPLVPNFPVFTRSGEVTVSIDLVRSDMKFTAEELTKLNTFERTMFKRVLRLEKDPMSFDPDNADSSYTVIPLNKDQSGNTVVDWAFINMLEKSPLQSRKITQEKKKEKEKAKEKFVFKKEDFEDAVVMPSYRNIDQPQYFYVAEIRTDLNPRSPFPSPELYDTFEAYYTSKYGLEITDPNQPLLDVDHTSARLNLLTPRYMNQKGVALPTSSAETRRARRENLQQKQILIPELCDIHPFPASLWRKAVCIPAILYRMNYLLVAEELRFLIASEACIGQVELDKDFRFPELEFGFSTNPSEVAAKSKESENDDVGGVENEDLNVECPQEEHESEECTQSGQNETKVDKCQENDPKGKMGVTEENEKPLQTMDKCPCDNRCKIGLQDSCDVSVIQTDSCKQKPSNLTNGHVHNDLRNIAENETCMEEEKIDMNERTIPTSETSETSSDICDTQRTITESVKCSQDTNTADIDETLDDLEDKVKKINVSNSVDLSVVDECRSDEKDCDKGVLPIVTFDNEFDLKTFIGPSPCIILQSLTMSNANDFFNLERLETIGDSFLKFAITVYLYCSYPGIHEGKLSYLRSKQVSNYNLYKLGKKKNLPDSMVAAKFEPTENWLPPGYIIKKDGAFNGLGVYIASTVRVSRNRGKKIEKEVNDSESQIELSNKMVESHHEGEEEVQQIKIKLDEKSTEVIKDSKSCQEHQFKKELEMYTEEDESEKPDPDVSFKCLIPYNLQTQHSLPDKSIADCVEALIGCYLVTCGQQAALQFMSWLKLKVLPEDTAAKAAENKEKYDANKESFQPANTPAGAGFGTLHAPPSPLLAHVPDAPGVLQFYLTGYEAFERKIQYHFNDKSYLLQAFTHASYHYNTVTDCYQRLEFLGDAILDYVITRHLFEDPKKHSPGILTDLRSALVNNNIFAALAVKWNFHKFFKAVSPQLFSVIEKFVNWQKDQGDEMLVEEELEVSEEDEKEEEKEDIEIPKALGDIFESVAGAIYLDSGMSLDTVWRVYYRMMKPQIDAFTEKIPKSPVRELLEMEPETAKFERPERTMNGRIRVTVTVVGKGTFKGVGRNYRIAKSAAAKRALKYIRLYNIEMLKEQQKYAAMAAKAMSGDFTI